MTAREDVPIAPADPVKNFHLAIQRGRIILHLLTLPILFLGKLAGVINVSVTAYLVFYVLALPSSFIIYFVYARGLDRRLPFALDRVWMTLDVLFVSISIGLTGGIESPFFVFYLSASAVAAFVRSMRTVIVITVSSVVAYFVTLALVGDIQGLDRQFFLAAFRMASIYAPTFLLIRGITLIQEKRATIRQMRREDQRKVEELTRLAAELDQKSRDLADANIRIREADRAKSQFLANMSHELRTPMNSIIGFAEILIERLNGEIPSRYSDFLNHILTSAQHLLSIINDVLDLSKIEAGKMEIFPERFEVTPVIDGVCKIMKGQSDSARVEIVADVPADLPHIETDLAKFKQILYNLLSNAVKFSQPQTRVTVRASATSSALTVAVIDEGIGIAPDDQRKVFEEFRQLDDSARRERSGTGLGLALVKRFVEMQNGVIALESEPGKGSTFSFTLPLEFTGDRSALDIFTDERVALTPGERVLVIEDDPIAFDAISAHLQSAAYIPIRARHGDEALRLARRVQPVAITLDLVLPGVDGWDVLKTLKGDPMTSDIPVVVISMVDQRELGLALGAHDYFLKPVDRGRLVERVRQLSGASTSRSRILLIDDDARFCEMIGEEIASSGYEVSCATNGMEGLREATERPPQLIILDLMMPGMSGFEVAERLKQDPRTSSIPILVMTAKEVTADERHLLQSQSAALIPKGQSKARLLGAIKQLERARAKSSIA